MEKDKEIDNLFKKGLEPPDGHSAYMEDDWGAMEKMLDERKKRPAILYWLPVLGGIAALIILVIGWWLLQPAVKPQHNTQQAVNRPILKETVKPAARQNNALKDDTIAPAIAGVQSAPAANKNENLNQAAVSIYHTKPNNGSQTAVSPAIAKNNTVNGSPGIAIPANGAENTILNEATLVAFNPGIVVGQADAGRTINQVNVLPKAGNTSGLSRAKPRTSFASRPQFAISAIASSDKNGVNSLQQGKPGNNAGLLFSMSFKKFTISTGAVYSSKQYATDFASYHTAYQFPVNPSSVSADCKMLDIPLNIDYQVFKNYRNKISVGSGFSSYLMLHENYLFKYAGYAKGPVSHNVANPGSYLFSIVNLQATYTRQINSKFGLSIQPYMKLPISNIGFSQVRLQSTGVAVGLSWNLNSSSNP